MAPRLPEIGITLPTIGEEGDVLPDVRAAARLAEEVGLDSVWTGDHLAVGANPMLDAPLALASALAVTERLSVGFSVLLPALRPFAWAGRQVASLQQLADGERLRLGVGLGGHEPEWHAAGSPSASRARRTDDFLRLLPRLLGGERVTVPEVPGRPEVTLRPAVPVPEVWVGGGFAPAALRRVARYGDGWLAALQEPEPFAASAARLTELAGEYGRPAPRLATMVHGALAPAGRTEGLHASYADRLAAAYGMDEEAAHRVSVTGDPEQVAERLAEFAEAGAEQFVLTTPVPDWHRTAELLGEARTLLHRHLAG